MILLTRLNNQALTVNSDLIKFVEESPDTMITLLNGEKLLVRESPAEVRSRVVEFRRCLLQGSAAVAGSAAVNLQLQCQSAEQTEEQRG